MAILSISLASPLLSFGPLHVVENHTFTFAAPSPAGFNSQARSEGGAIAVGGDQPVSICRLEAGMNGIDALGAVSTTLSGDDHELKSPILVV